jgi:hypothetical protein
MLAKVLAILDTGIPLKPTTHTDPQKRQQLVSAVEKAEMKRQRKAALRRLYED